MRRTACLTAVVLLLAGCAGTDGAGDRVERAASGSSAAPASPGAEPSEGEDGAAAPAIEGLETLAEDPSHDHVEGPIEYDRVPPLGGEHNPRWLACDVYDEPVPLETAVHSIEHGAVWIAYSPDLPADQVEQLAELAELDDEYVLVAPQDGLDSRVVAVTWGAAIEASAADDPRLEQFVEAYAGGGQGGEPGAPCKGDGLSLEEAQEAVED
jgi:hypothetical protein